MPQIEVTFDIDANGMLHVTAKDKASNKEQSIRITSSSGLSKEEVEKMKRDATEHASEDKKRKEDIETRNQGDALSFQAKKFIKEYEGKLPSDVKEKIDSGVAKLDDAIKVNNIPEIKSSMDALNQVMSEAGQKMYEEAAKQQPPQGQPGGQVSWAAPRKTAAALRMLPQQMGRKWKTRTSKW